MRIRLCAIAAAMTLLFQARGMAQDDPLPPGALARLGTQRFRHGAWLGALAIAPDGRLLASAGRDGKIRLFDRGTGRQVRVLEAGDAGRAPACLAFSPDGKMLACGLAKERGAQLWEVATGRKVRSFPAALEMEELVFSPDGKALATRDSAKVLLWEVGTGRLLHEWKPQGFFFPSLHFIDGGRTLVAGENESGEGTIYFWDTASGKEKRRWSHPGLLHSLALSADGKTLAATENRAREKGELILQRGVHLWEVASGRHLCYFDTQSDADLTTQAWSPDGKTLVVGDCVGRLFFCDSAGGKVAHRAAVVGTVVSLLFVPGRSTVVSADDFGVFRLWDSSTGREIEPCRGHEGWIDSIVFSRDGRSLFSTGRDVSLRQWQTTTGQELRCKRLLSYNCPGLCLSSDGSILAVAPMGHGLHLHDPATGKLIRRLAPGRLIRSLAFSAGEKPLLVISAGYPKGAEISLWDASVGRRLRSKEHSEHVNQIALTPDGKTVLAALPLKGEVHILDGATLEQRRTLTISGLAGFTLSADGRRLATLGKGRFVELWDVASGRRLFRFDDANEDLSPLAFSPDRATLAAGDEQGAVRLWETATGRQRGLLVGHRGQVECLAFAPDGRSLASAGADTTILLWDLTRLATSKRKPPSEEELQALWNDLAGKDATRAYRAMWLQAHFPELSVPFLRRRLQPDTRWPAERLSPLIRALGSDSYAVREDASRTLEKAEEQAEPALRAALADASDLEVRRRLQLLLGKLDERVRDPQTLRAVRAVEALEHAGTAEARLLLEKLARGPEAARQTRQARAALEWLSKRSARKQSD